MDKWAGKHKLLSKARIDKYVDKLMDKKRAASTKHKKRKDVFSI